MSEQPLDDKSFNRVSATRISNNRFNFRGVEWASDRNGFRARITPDRNVPGRWLGTFATAEEAAMAYDEAARKIYGPDAHLNFPNEGEKRTMMTRYHDGFCGMGHNLQQTGRRSASGKINCRECNRLAQRRCQARRRSRKPQEDDR